MLKRFIILFIFFSNSFFLYAEGATVVVNPAQKSVSKGQIKQIVKGDREEWPSGGKVILLLNSDDKIMEDFCKSVLGMSYEAFQELHIRINIRSGKAAPRKVSTDVMLTLISKSKNFVGIVPMEKASSEGITTVD